MTLRQRILILAIPVYVMGVIVWRFALHQSWTLSFAGGPLGLFIGAVIYSLIVSFYQRRRMTRPGRGRR